ncbi:MAG: ribokinase [Oscillospiraceae bacterium]|jgi:ribokinase|nr:ribokinase [Oscillospiraceae bacterium]
MKQIFVVGSTAIDVSVRGGEVSVSLGGKASNQAIAAARAGGLVTLATKIGEDAFGGFAMDTWRLEALDTALCIRDPGYPTGVSVINVDANGENRITRGESASRRMNGADFQRYSDGVPYGGIFMTQLSSTVDVVLGLIRLAKSRGNLVILDPAPAVALPPDIWRYVDIVTPNESEAASLGDVPVRTRITTLGARGVRVTHDGAETFAEPYAVAAIDTTGAGDAFNGALATALSDGAEIMEAVRFANAAGALCSTRVGAAAATPYRNEIDELYCTR